MMTELVQRRLGTYSFIIEVAIPATATGNILINRPFPKNAETIYGISAVTGGVTSGNAAVITAAQSDELYLVLKRGTNDVFRIRLDQLVFATIDAGATVNPVRYFPVNFSAASLDLERSELLNPNSIVTNNVVLNFLYFPLSQKQ